MRYPLIDESEFDSLEDAAAFRAEVANLTSAQIRCAEIADVKDSLRHVGQVVRDDILPALGDLLRLPWRLIFPRYNDYRHFGYFEGSDEIAGPGPFVDANVSATAATAVTSAPAPQVDA